LICLTQAGDRIAEKEHPMSDFPSSLREQFNINARLCFMVMPFRSALNKVYDAVEEITEYCGLICLRADKIHGPRRITGDIWTNIKQSRFLIADLTNRNANVFYEVGVAHALGKTVILLAQKKSDVPFDVHDIRYIQYNPDDIETLRRNLIDSIKSCISTIPTNWNRRFYPPGWNGPYIKITSLESPSSISIDQPFEIILKARNTGGVANQGYFSVSFPNGMIKDLQIESDADSIERKVGKKYQPWANNRVVLSYPIAEGYKYDDSKPVWRSETEYFIRVRGYAERKGLLWFYVNACCRNEVNQEFIWDPIESLLDLDQRDENVYCGVIEVT
jgi:hypothetical protein